MARKKSREYNSKRLFKEHLKRLAGIEVVIQAAQVALNLDLTGVESFVKERLGKEVEMSGTKGPITTFIVEPFVPHSDEYYLSIVSYRFGADVSFSECGGIDIEENWDKIRQILEGFLRGSFAVFEDLDFTLLEMNPFTFVNNVPCPLDMRGELDDTAMFKDFQKWGNVEFPLPFGRTMTPAEEKVHKMVEKTGASLKLTILNPKGHLWTMVTGGGVSVIYADKSEIWVTHTSLAIMLNTVELQMRKRLCSMHVL